MRNLEDMYESFTCTAGEYGGLYSCAFIIGGMSGIDEEHDRSSHAAANRRHSADFGEPYHLPRAGEPIIRQLLWRAASILGRLRVSGRTTGWVAAVSHECGRCSAVESGMRSRVRVSGK